MSDVIWYVFFVGIFVLLLVVILLIVLDWRKDRKAAVKANNEKQPVVIYISKDGTVKTDSDKVKIDQEVAKTVKEEPLKEESKPVTTTENVQDGTVIKCTPTHRFMLSDGTYKQAQDLTEEDELADFN